MRIPIHREGWVFIAIFAGVNALLYWLSPWAGLAFAPLTIWCIAFFRDPERTPPPGENLLVSPADGVLLPIIEAVPPEELGLGPAPRRRLSIFMNVFNVHVNRMPVSGTVVALAYRPGRFFNASFDKASIHNERMSARVRPTGSTDPDADLVVVQIAGLVARRIVCDLKLGDTVVRGDRYGMIRFGSRLDVYLPPMAKIVINGKLSTVSGQTVLAQTQGLEP
ncbi:MAG TPA: phosphatidylserine decarboxylase [Rhizomicrobium sp.]|jgi:phosphatidylserine decarboxylase|nr:phosphatidylserine decarboxylase [Rhizomicrobium sp.]